MMSHGISETDALSTWDDIPRYMDLPQVPCGVRYTMYLH